MTEPVLFRDRIVAAFFLIPVIVLLVASTLFAEDLAKRYPASLEFSKKPRSYDTQARAEDVWRLSAFEYELSDQFKIKLGVAQVVFGQHQNNVLWAAVFPDSPGEIVTARPGAGEKITSIWLRLHPARVGDLFPEKTVLKQGDDALLTQANRLASHKMSSSWQQGGRAMVPLPESVIFDLETKEGSRRFFAIDTRQETVKYVGAFRTRSLPVAVAFKPEAGAEIFDKVWDSFDREYAMFAVKPDVNWQKLREQYRPRAIAAKSNWELAEVLSEMLSHLEDLHVYVLVDGSYVKGFNRPRFFNASPPAAPQLVGPLKQTKGMRWGRTKDDLGYIAVDSLSVPALSDRFEAALKQMQGTHGLILDLRANGGGAEPLARKMAGYFLDQQRVYAMHQFRNGPEHSDLTAKQERSFQPNEDLYYRGPVIALQGEKTMSSAEAFVLMLAACPTVTTMGDRTAGSSGNPRRVEAGAGIVVNLPRWIPLDRDGKTFDAVGVKPDVAIKVAPSDLTRSADPLLTAALTRLRKQIREQDGSSEETLVPRE